MKLKAYIFKFGGEGTKSLIVYAWDSKQAWQIVKLCIKQKNMNNDVELSRSTQKQHIQSMKYTLAKFDNDEEKLIKAEILRAKHWRINK